MEEAVAAARAGIMAEKKATAENAYNDAAPKRLAANKALHGYCPPDGGMDTACGFFGNNGIYPTKVPIEITDMRMHLPLGYRYHVRSQVMMHFLDFSDLSPLFSSPLFLQTHFLPWNFFSL